MKRLTCHLLSLSFLLLLCLTMFTACSFELITPVETTEPHDHEYGDWEVATPPTCTAEGTDIRICSCGQTELRPIAPLGHTAIVDPAVAPSCTETGLTEGTHCSACGTVLVAQETVKATGHSYSTALTLPTCTEKGYTTYTCACGDTYTDNYVSAIGHATVIDEALTPTCTENGLTVGAHCSTCDTVLVAQEEIKARGHNYSAVVFAPTCTENGYTTHTCACGDFYVDDYTAAKGHTVAIQEMILPTCTKEGYTAGAYCSVCEAVLVSPTEIEATGHTIVIDPGIQPTCTKPGISIGCHCSTCGEVLLPQETLAAKGHSYSTTVTPPTCTENGYTTHTCTCGDTYVDLYTDPEHPNANRDEVCDLCGDILPGLYNAYGQMIVSWKDLKDVYGMNAAKSYSPETYATDTSSPHYILTKNSAFAALSEIRIILADDEAIGDYAFFGCISLVSIDVRNATSIGDNAFSGCINLENIQAGNDNARYYSQNDCLIETATGRLILGCKSSQIPSDVSSIGDAAFRGSGISSILIPNSVTTIGNRVFDACDRLETIYYLGTTEEWSAITANATAPLPVSASLYFYSEKLPTANGNYWHYENNLPEKYPPLGEKNYTFGAFSDVHFSYSTLAEGNLKRALSYLESTENVDFLCLAGDQVSNGTLEEFAYYKALIDSISPSFPIYEIAGNHEAQQYVGTTELVKPYFGEELYYSFTKGDDVYIMFGIQGYRATRETFSAESLQWLYETLEANRNKRCFVFQHAPRFDGSGVPYQNLTITENMLNSESGQIFLSLMEHYTNVIWFHGHTHMNLKYNEACSYFLYDRMYGCHSVHLPSLGSGKTLNDEGTGFSNVYTEGEGYVIDVYDNYIVMRGYSFAYTGIAPILSFTIDTTLDVIEAQSYTDPTGTITP